jgi:hypothetical protein
VAHVARAGRDVVHRRPLALELGDGVDDLEQRVAVAAGDVHRLARDALGVHGEQVRVHDVVDVREVARLLAVAVDLERLTQAATARGSAG